MQQNKLKKLYAIALILTCLIISWFLIGNKIFGNDIDWLNQHVAIADLLRSKMRATGTLIPLYISELMGGANPYNFAYYGLLRPDVIIGALFPSVPMLYLVAGYSFILMIATVILSYYFLIKNGIKEKIAWIVALFVFCSALFFQSHRQIMFVNYLPFLFLGLLGIDYFIEKNKISIFVLAGCLMICHSYFYSLVNVVVCFIYFFYKSQWKPEKKKLCRFIFSGIVIISITGILTIPTAFAILSNTKSVTVTNYGQLFIPDLSLRSLLYSNYGCGFTYLAYICLVLGLMKQKTRIMAIILMLVFVFPVFSYICNGFLYARGKILIAFIPLVSLMIGKVLQSLAEGDFELKSYLLILLVLPIPFFPLPWLVLADLIISSLILLLVYYRKKEMVLYLLTVIPVLTLVINNPRHSFIDRDFYREYQNKEKNELILNGKIERLSEANEQIINTNNTYGGLVTKVSGYTSTYNSLYNHYLYDKINNSIRANNRVNHLDNSNRIHLGLMGVDSLVTKKKAPLGYKLVRSTKNYKLYQSREILPLVYASSRLVSYRDYDKLTFPYNLDTIYNNTIVNKGDRRYNSKFIREDINITEEGTPLKKVDNTYYFRHRRRQKFRVPLYKNYKNKLIALEFKVINRSDRKIAIGINGVINKLSNRFHPYYNGNDHFTYLLNSHNLKELVFMFSKGDYAIKDLKMYSLDYKEIKDRYRQVDPLKMQKTITGFKGKIQVKQDGYLVTSVPYAKGYTLKIDGKAVEIERVNGAFIGSKISKGEHKINLSYQIPGFNIGIISGLIGLFLLVINWKFERKMYEEKF